MLFKKVLLVSSLFIAFLGVDVVLAKSQAAATAPHQHSHRIKQKNGVDKSKTVDLNLADAKTLASDLKGISKKKAEAIVAYREKHGPFKKIEDLAHIKGITKKTIKKLMAQNKGKITLNSAN